ncbi:hypothetical protein POTOM_053810 [Populus tomentosa]|uniref:Uncharacterized protein n=1 Tax=Populus tomentosa TaxID=118781 RepID=A0A8X8C7W9_POPTO|nr:hypothetical protein POTOM_053810 [Populus tomentosa]
MTVRERERNSKNDSQETGGCDTEDQGSRDLIKKKVGYVHSQVLRIREEDSHLGEERLSAAKEMIRKALIGKLQESFGVPQHAAMEDLLLMEDELEVKEMQFVN